MTSGLRSLGPIALALMMALGSCAQTKLHVWVDPTYKGGRFNKIMVIGIADNLDRRRIFENQFVAEFGRRGVEAVSSVRLMPGQAKVSEEAIRAAIVDSGVDAVIVTRLVGLDIKYKQSPGGSYAVPYPYYSSLYGYYSHAFVVVTAPPEYDAKETASLETNLYEVENEKLIWTVLSKTTKKHSITDSIMSVTGTLIDRLIKDRLL